MDWRDRKDFGDLVFRQGQAATAGVVLFRLAGIGHSEAGPLILSALNSRDNWPGHFSVVDADIDHIRMTPAP